MGNELATTNRFDEMKSTAVALVESGLFGVNNWQQALALGMISEAEGQPFVLAVRDYHVIKGKPVLKSEAMLSRFQKAGGKMKMIEHSDTRVVAEFSHAQSGTVVIDWDIERARRAGLTAKDNWKSWPRQMLRARVISEGVRATFPGATSGMMTPEEAADIPGAAPELDVTPAKPVTGLTALQARVAEVKAHVVPQMGDPIGKATHVDRVPLELTPEEPPSKVTLADVLAAIHEAQDDDALNNAGALANALSDGDKGIARKAWREKAKELTPPAEATA